MRLAWATLTATQRDVPRDGAGARPPDHPAERQREDGQLDRLEAKRLLRRRELLCDQLAKFCDVQKALTKRGVGRLYLTTSKSEEKAMPRAGGETNLSRLHAEIHVLEAVLKHHKN